MRTLQSDLAPDGGGFVPETLALGNEEIRRLLRLPFSECVCRILGLLFDSQPDPIDLGLYVGRNPVRLTRLGHKTCVGEGWHSVTGTFSETVNSVAKLLGSENADIEGGWRRIGIASAFLCGLLGRATEHGESVNFAAMAEDMTLLMSAWYVRSWGFPIRKILCCSREGDGLWELFHNGVLDTAGPVPLELERLLYHTDGAVEAERFSDCCRLGSPYYIDEQMQQRLIHQMQVCVIGEKRIGDTISGIYGSSGYLMPAVTAGAYAGAMDYRGAAGDQEAVLLLAEDSPVRDAAVIAGALHVSEQAFLDHWKNR